MFAQAVAYIVATIVAAVVIAFVGIQFSAVAGIVVCVLAIAAEVGAMLAIEGKKAVA